MPPMRRITLFPLVCALLLLSAPAASAEVQELGLSSDRPASSCPKDCQAVGRVTGYTVTQKGGSPNPFKVKASGKVVAFSLRLGKPNASQAAYFRQNFGGTPKARISILRRGKNNVHRLLAQSGSFKLERYFGSTPTFALDRPLKVPAGAYVALTVPTWAPAFSVGLGKNEVWRSSRAKGKCDRVTGHYTHQKINSLKTYGCTYPNARLRYTATFVTDPKPT